MKTLLYPFKLIYLFVSETIMLFYLLGDLLVSEIKWAWKINPFLYLAKYARELRKKIGHLETSYYSLIRNTQTLERLYSEHPSEGFKKLLTTSLVHKYIVGRTIRRLKNDHNMIVDKWKYYSQFK